MQRNCFVILLVVLLFGTLVIAARPIRAVDFYLTLDNSPSEVLTIDPEAVTGEGYYPSGSWVTIDAKQTVTSGAVSYEFVEWSTTDNSMADPEDVEDLTGNQALIFMDSDRTVTAIYEEQFVGTWENSFESASGFALRISTNDKYFQFITPEKTYSITEADSMIVIGRTTTIFHSDDKLTLISFSNSNVDYCLTYAQDMQTGQRYVLLDRIGFE
jgi:hypothetical protein